MVNPHSHTNPLPLFLPPLGGEGRGGGAMSKRRLILNRHPSLALPIEGREQSQRQKTEDPLTLTLSPPERGARGQEKRPLGGCLCWEAASWQRDWPVCFVR